MSHKYKFDETARTERYFVGTLFSHLLLADNFTGLRNLFKHVFGTESCFKLPDDFEIVSELDPLRDGSVINSKVKVLYQEFKRVAVPDLFLRWSHLCLVIEAKFFTDPAADDLHEQIYLQREAITKVKPYVFYKDFDIRFAVLTVKPINKLSTENLTHLVWDEVLDVIDQGSTSSKDVVYTRTTIRNALVRATSDLRTSKITFEKMGFDDILLKLPHLVAQGKIYVGFTGGTAALYNSTLSLLQNRSHYKVSDTRWSDNWITLDQFLRRVFELRGYFEKIIIS